MLIREVVELLDAKVVYGDHLMDSEIRSACGSDLMSDVLAFAKSDSLLLTGLVNCQVLRTAEMMDFKAIAFVRGKKPGDDIISLAKQIDIAVLMTSKPLYSACGILYSSGLNELENDVSWMIK